MTVRFVLQLLATGALAVAAAIAADPAAVRRWISWRRLHREVHRREGWMS